MHISKSQFRPLADVFRIFGCELLEAAHIASNISSVEDVKKLHERVAEFSERFQAMLDSVNREIEVAN